MAADPAWEAYPENWSRDDGISWNATELQRRLKDPAGGYFLKDDEEEEVNVRITDVYDGMLGVYPYSSNTKVDSMIARAESKLYNNAKKLWGAVEQRQDERSRIRIM
jgi:hypothetical protein